MALGGGTFTAQNKKLPGAYINNISASSASASISDRGVATVPVDLPWGPDDIFTVTAEDFQTKTRKIFGVAYDDAALKPLREVFRGARTVYVYRLNAGGVKASNTFATAKYTGTFGNGLRTIISKNADDSSKWDVETNVTDGSVTLDIQTVAKAADLVDNDWLTFKKDATLAAGTTPLEGGTDKTHTGADIYSTYLAKASNYRFNTMGVASTEDAVNTLVAAYCKRLRDDQGVKFQVCLYNTAADYMGVINIKNKIMDEGATGAELVYWITGQEAGCKVNATLSSKVYDGEYTVEVPDDQATLEDALDNGQLILHRNGDDIEVLEDINSMVSTTDTEGEIFKDNQTIRVIDDMSNSDALCFNKSYRGKVLNGSNGRISLWGQLVKIRQALQTTGAIENFTDTDVVVSQGDGKKKVAVSSAITIVNTMEQLYLTNTIQ